MGSTFGKWQDEGATAKNLAAGQAAGSIRRNAVSGACLCTTKICESAPRGAGPCSGAGPSTADPFPLTRGAPPSAKPHEGAHFFFFFFFFLGGGGGGGGGGGEKKKKKKKTRQPGCIAFSREDKLSPTRVSMVHLREKGAAAFARILGTEVAFGSEVDEIVFPSGAPEFPLVDADPRLNKILVEVSEDALSARKRAVGINVGPVRMLVENAVTPLLPHGTVRADMVAKKLGMSERTLARRLAEEGVTFIEIVQQLKATLARYYLEEETMPISKIAWLLGFEEPSSFSHACKRWTGKTPRELRGAELALG